MRGKAKCKAMYQCQARLTVIDKTPLFAIPC
ncbi:hypothetical protein M2263_000999 [Providencia alcalifaciens]|nr:hypothetical protein [Providencia alcalifaciens]